MEVANKAFQIDDDKFKVMRIFDENGLNIRNNNDDASQSYINFLYGIKELDSDDARKQRAAKHLEKLFNHSKFEPQKTRAEHLNTFDGAYWAPDASELCKSTAKRNYRNYTQEVFEKIKAGENATKYARQNLKSCAIREDGFSGYLSLVWVYNTYADRDGKTQINLPDLLTYLSTLENNQEDAESLKGIADKTPEGWSITDVDAYMTLQCRYLESKYQLNDARASNLAQQYELNIVIFEDSKYNIFGSAPDKRTVFLQRIDKHHDLLMPIKPFLLRFKEMTEGQQRDAINKPQSLYEQAGLVLPSDPTIKAFAEACYSKLLELVSSLPELRQNTQRKLGEAGPIENVENHVINTLGIDGNLGDGDFVCWAYLLLMMAHNQTLQHREKLQLLAVSRFEELQGNLWNRFITHAQWEIVKGHLTQTWDSIRSDPDGFVVNYLTPLVKEAAEGLLDAHPLPDGVSRDTFLRQGKTWVRNKSERFADAVRKKFTPVERSTDGSKQARIIFNTIQGELGTEMLVTSALTEISREVALDGWMDREAARLADSVPRPHMSDAVKRKHCERLSCGAGEVIETCYRRAARKSHPNNKRTGSKEAFQLVQSAKDELDKAGEKTC